MTFTESDFTMLAVFATAAHSVYAVAIRPYIFRMPWKVAVGSGSVWAMAMPILYVVTVAPTSVYSVILLLAMQAQVMYNYFYLIATDDQLAEGVIWPRVRDWMLVKMAEMEKEDGVV